MKSSQEIATLHWLHQLYPYRKKKKTFLVTIFSVKSPFEKPLNPIKSNFQLVLKSHENSSESRAADLPRLNDTEDSFEPPATQLVNLWPNVTNFDLFGAYVPEKKRKF